MWTGSHLIWILLNRFEPVQTGSNQAYYQFWHKRRRCSLSPFRQSTGNGVYGLLFSRFFHFPFLSFTYNSFSNKKWRLWTLSRKLRHTAKASLTVFRINNLSSLKVLKILKKSSFLSMCIPNATYIYFITSYSISSLLDSWEFFRETSWGLAI